MTYLTSDNSTLDSTGHSTLRNFAVILACALAGSILIAWVTSQSWLTSLGTSAATMKPSTAVCVLLIGAGVAFNDRRRSIEATFAVILAALISIASLIQTKTGVNLGVENFLGLTQTKNGVSGLMSNATALAFLLLICSFLFRNTSSFVFRLFLFAPALIGLVGIIGHLSGTEKISYIPGFDSLSLPAAICTWLLATSLLTLDRAYFLADLDSNKTDQAAWPFITAIAVLILCAGCTWVAAKKYQESAKRAAEQEFNVVAERLWGQIDNRLQHFEFGLNGLLGLFNASKSVERREFIEYVAAMNVREAYPGALGAGFIERICREDLSDFTASVRADDSPNFDIKSNSDASDLFVIRFIEPVEDNWEAWGFDIGQESRRREAAEQAMMTGKPMLTASIDLVQEHQKRKGFLYLLPVYKKGLPTSTEKQRTAACLGWVYMPIVIDHAFDGLLAELGNQVDFEVFDGAATHSGALLFDADGHHEEFVGQLAEKDFADRLYASRRSMKIGGRTWTFWLSSTDDFDAAVGTKTVATTIAIGSFISLLLSLLVWSLISSRSRAMLLAKEMTTEHAAATRRAEDALREVTELRSALDEHTIVSVTDADGKIVEVNTAFCLASGYSRSELIGTDHQILNSGVQDPSLWSAMWHSIKHGQPWNAEVCNRRKDRSLYWVHLTVVPFTNNEGKLSKIVSISYDITNRKSAEDELKRMNREARLLHDTATLASEAIYEDKCLQRVLDSVCDFTGWPVGHVYRVVDQIDRVSAPTQIWHIRNDSRYQKFKELTERTSFPCGIGLPGRVVATGKPAFIDDVNLDANFPRNKALNDLPVKGAFCFPVKVEGRVYYTLEFFHDEPFTNSSMLFNSISKVSNEISRVIENKRRELELATYTKQLEAQSKQLAELNVNLESAKRIADDANKSKSEFLANMSHEIRTPMTAILGFADLLFEDGDVARAPEKRVNAIRTIQRNGQHLLAIINDILDLSKIEAGKLHVERIKCKSCEILAEIDSLMKVRANHRNITFKIESEGPIPEVIKSDPLRLKQILINLVGNAIKFTSDGEVRLVARFVDFGKPMMEFDVIDSGIGMTPDQAENLFQPFTQADTSTTRKFGGTGLGLTISRRLANILGGDISIVNTERNVGTTIRASVETGAIKNVDFVEDLERAIRVGFDFSATLESVIDTELSQDQLQDVRVLLAEDGIDNQRLISILLEKAGASVTIVDNGRAAMATAMDAIASDQPFDIVLMDMQMPIMDGYEATACLREQGYNRPIVALTAHAMDGEQNKCLAAGCSGYLTKPITKQILIGGIINNLKKSAKETKTY